MQIILAEKQSPCSFVASCDHGYELMSIVTQIMNYLRAGGAPAILNLRLEHLDINDDPDKNEGMIMFKKIIDMNTLPEETISIERKGEPLRLDRSINSVVLLHITLDTNHKEK